jgi:5'-nucleotidase
MVVSGINNGSNLGDDVIYSGTVAAAIEGRFLGLPAIAVSLVGETLRYYDTAARVAVEMIKTLEHTPLQRDTILNINVPDIPWEQLDGIEATRCGARHQSQPIISMGRSDDSNFFQIGPAGNEADAGPGTDFYAVANNKVSVTPLQIDMTRYSRMPEIAKWITAVKVQ